MHKENIGSIKKFFCVAAIVLFSEGIMANQDEYSSSTRTFLAGEAVYRDFSMLVEQQVDTSGMSMFMADIANYEIVLREETNLYVVTFTPKRYKDQTLRGGGAEYRVDKKYFHMIGIARYE